MEQKIQSISEPLKAAFGLMAPNMNQIDLHMADKYIVHEPVRENGKIRKLPEDASIVKNNAERYRAILLNWCKEVIFILFKRNDPAINDDIYRMCKSILYDIIIWCNGYTVKDHLQLIGATAIAISMMTDITLRYPNEHRQHYMNQELVRKIVEKTDNAYSISQLDIAIDAVKAHDPARLKAVIDNVVTRVWKKGPKLLGNGSYGFVCNPPLCNIDPDTKQQIVYDPAEYVSKMFFEENSYHAALKKLETIAGIADVQNNAFVAYPQNVRTVSKLPAMLYANAKAETGLRGLDNSNNLHIMRLPHLGVSLERILREKAPNRPELDAFRSCEFHIIMEQLHKCQTILANFAKKKHIHGDMDSSNMMWNKRTKSIHIIDFDWLYPYEKFAKEYAPHFGHPRNPPETDFIAKLNGGGMATHHLVSLFKHIIPYEVSSNIRVTDLIQSGTDPRINRAIKNIVEKSKHPVITDRIKQIYNNLDEDDIGRHITTEDDDVWLVIIGELVTYDNDIQVILLDEVLEEANQENSVALVKAINQIKKGTKLTTEKAALKALEELSFPSFDSYGYARIMLNLFQMAYPGSAEAIHADKLNENRPLMVESLRGRISRDGQPYSDAYLNLIAKTLLDVCHLYFQMGTFNMTVRVNAVDGLARMKVIHKQFIKAHNALGEGAPLHDNDPDVVDKQMEAVVNEAIAIVDQQDEAASNVAAVAASSKNAIAVAPRKKKHQIIDIEDQLKRLNAARQNKPAAAAAANHLSVAMHNSNMSFLQNELKKLTLKGGKRRKTLRKHKTKKHPRKH